MSTHQVKRKASGSAKARTVHEAACEVLGEVVPLEIHEEAIREITKCDVTDQQSCNNAGLRAKQLFVDFFTEAFHRRPDITPEAIDIAATVMTLGVLEEFKKAALISMGGFSPNVAPGAPIIRH